MSYSNTVKLQYWTVGMCSAVLACALVFGWYLSTQAGKCSGQLIRQPQGLYCFTNLGNIQEDDVR